MNFLAQLLADGKVEVDKHDPKRVQLKQRSDNGARCNLLTGLDMLFGVG
jgi:hypothetical protein